MSKEYKSVAEQEWAKYQKNELGMNPSPLRSVEVVEAVDEENSIDSGRQEECGSSPWPKVPIGLQKEYAARWAEGD